MPTTTLAACPAPGMLARTGCGASAGNSGFTPERRSDGTAFFVRRERSMPRIEKDHQAVTQITFIEVEPEKQPEALSLMTERARFMARQPGFISISLHRSLNRRRIVNYIQWVNRELLQATHTSPDLRKALRKFDDLTDQIDPHLYEVTESIEAARSAS